MSTPQHHVSHGTPEAYREFIAEMLGMARIQAEIGETYAATGDDAGLEYAMRRLVAYTRAALGTLADLKTEKHGGADERAA
jgi:hypothetical protein